tara:strand:+ start:1278 stop:1979 length:702 start_codon:yes stop_codon:yes gene_type:complete
MQYLTNNHTECLFEQLAKLFIREAVSLLEKQSCIYVALPGGRSILGFLEALNKQIDSPDSAMIDLSRINFYLVDERITTDGNELNEHLLNSSFFMKLTISLNTYFDLNNCFEEYNNYFLSENIRFDFVFLGVGEDGHIASIFPHDNSALISEKNYLKINNSPKPPLERITLSKKSILDARHIVLLFVDEGKKRALDNFISDKISTEDCPAKLSLQEKNKIIVATNLMNIKFPR